MKKLVLIACAAAGLVSSGFAGTWYYNRLGSFDNWNSSDGAHYTGSQLGSFYNWSGHDQFGNYHSGTGYWLGNTYIETGH